MDELEQYCEFAIKATMDLIQQKRYITDGIIPEYRTNLFFGNTSVCHFDDSLPCLLS